MFTTQLNTLPQRQSTGPVSGKVAVGIAALLAVAVAILFLVLGTTGAIRHLTQTRVTASYPPMIQYHGTGATPVVHRVAAAGPTTGAPRGYSIPGDTRTEHSYGAVP